MKDLATALNDWRTIENARELVGAATVGALQHLLNLSISEELRKELLAQCTALGLTFKEHNEGTTVADKNTTYTEKDI